MDIRGAIKWRLDSANYKIRRLSKYKRPLKVAPSLDDYRITFVVGMHRSGTSLFHDCIRGHDEVTGLTDTGVWEDEGHLLSSVLPKDRGPGEFAFDEASRLTELSPLCNDRTRDSIVRDWGPYFDLRKRHIVEKSPPTLIRARFFQRLFPGCGFIFLVRHPVSVASSTKRFSARSTSELLFHWHLGHAMLLDDLKYLERYHIVRYEDLLKTPDAVLNASLRFMGVNDIESVSHSVKPQERSSLDSKIAEIKNLRALDFMSTPNAPMSVFGYSLAPPFVSSAPPSF